MTPQEEQEKLLEDALAAVKTQAFQMKRSLDKSKLMDGLKHASNMLNELRTSLLSPKNYYELYMVITNELLHLEVYLSDEFTKGRKVADLYEIVQYAGNIIPRLYLLITVGVVYIKSNELPKKDVLKDLVEMCRGVQHPLRGLFLRNYLLQCTKNVLPDSVDVENQGDILQHAAPRAIAGLNKLVNGPESDRGGSIKDSIEFIQLNFAEMNKLWVRMQHQGHTRDREKREQERRELRILVGTNLVRLSQLECVDIDVYKRLVLTDMMEQIVSCRDAIAQEYLMECIIQVFPDEYHLQTLNSILQGCSDLQPEVNVKTIVISLIDRLTNYCQKTSIKTEVDLFDIFSLNITQLIQTHSTMPPEDIILLQVALINLAIKCYQDKYEYVNKVLESTCGILEKLNLKNMDSGSVLSKGLVRLLRIPVEEYNNVITLLQLSNYTSLLNCLSFNARKSIALFIIGNALDNNTIVSSPEQVEGVMGVINPLLTVEEGSKGEDGDAEEVAEEQNMLARFIHLMRGSNNDSHYLVLNTARKSMGSNASWRLKYTLPSIIFSAFELAQSYYTDKDNDDKWEKKCQKIFQFCHQTIGALIKVELAELPLRLFLVGSLYVSKIPFENHETVAYEFMSQAFMLYEDEISDSKAQVNAIQLIIGTFEKMQCFSDENHSPLRAKCSLAAVRLLRKPDQCRGILMCSQLFWCSIIQEKEQSKALSDSKGMMECLKKANKIVTNCMDKMVQIQLQIETLNAYIVFFKKKFAQINEEALNALSEQIKSELNELEDNDEKNIMLSYYNKTAAYLKHILGSQ